MIHISDVLDRIVIKQHAKAEKMDQNLIKDGIDTKKAYLNFKSAYLASDSHNTQNDNLYSYEFTADELSKFTTNINHIRMMSRLDGQAEAIRRFLSEKDQKELIKLKRRKIIDSYVEFNPYYRELMGQPPIKRKTIRNSDGELEEIFVEDSDSFYYIKDSILGVDNNKPIHRWTRDQKALLAKYEFPKDLVQKYPYLKYVHKNIDIIDLRDAEEYDIVWSDIKRSDSGVDLLSFIYNYRLVRKYYLANHHNPIDTLKYPYMESITCILLFMTTLAHTNAQSIKKGVTVTLPIEEVYNLFESYGLPKFKFSLKYLNLLASKLNTFVWKKGTNINLEDISDTFHDIKIFKYFLIKTISHDGIEGHESDYVKYDLKFVKTPLLVDNPYDYLDDEENIYPFDEIVSKDPRWGSPTHLTKLKFDHDIQRGTEMINTKKGVWVEDPKLELELKHTDFSWTESKYLGIDATIKLGWMSMKIAMLYRWFVDNKDKSERYKVYFDYIDIDTSVFELLLYLQCLIFYKYKRKPSVPDTLKTYFKIYTKAEKVDMRQVKAVVLRTYREILMKNYINNKDIEPNANMDNIKVDAITEDIDTLIMDNRYGDFKDLNAIMDEYFERNKIDDRLIGIMGKVMNFDKDENPRIPLTNKPKPKVEKEIVEAVDVRSDLFNTYNSSISTTNIEESLTVNEDNTEYFHPGVENNDFADVNKRMYNNYSKFEINFDIMKLLYDVRSNTKDYKDYEMIDTMIKVLSQGEKVVHQFSKEDGNGNYDNLLDYLVSLGPYNNKFATRIAELSSDEENYKHNFDSEIIEVIVALKNSKMMNEAIHENASDALDYIQRFYTENEVIRYITEVVDFFKSYTQDIINKGMTYILDDADNITHILEDLQKEIGLKDWDLGTMTLLLSTFPTETLKRIRTITSPSETIFTSERLELYIPFLKKYKELASDGLYLT